MHVTRMFGVIFVLAFMSLGAEGINHWNIEYFIIQYKVKTISDTTSISCHVKQNIFGQVGCECSLKEEISTPEMPSWLSTSATSETDTARTRLVLSQTEQLLADNNPDFQTTR